MRRVVFVFICVFNFSLNQAKTQSYGVPRYGETNSRKTFTDYTSPIFVLPIRLKRQTYNSNYSNGVTVPNYSDGFHHNGYVNIGKIPNNRNTSTNRNQLPVNSYESYPKPQYEPNLGYQFNDNPVQGSDNTKPDILITQNTTRTRNSNNVGNRFGNDRPQRFDNSDTTNFNGQNTRSGYTGGLSVVNIGNGQGKKNIVDVYERRSGNSDGYFHNTDNTRSTRRGPTITNIGNGIGNRNEVYIQDNVRVLDRSVTATRRPAYRRTTNTQQTNYRQNWNPLNSNSRNNFYPSFNNDQVLRTYTRIGQGKDNTNLVYINGVPILSNSGLTISETNHKGQGEQPYYNTNQQIYISEDNLRVLPHRRFNQ
ncbi:probable serine/threonine-protein kinase clkA isoform X2 [Vanessa tameamea]|uniref:Probable serine/threonine-protein kinase clkA isoform X2 n=1 Tax=Vanessa tameamea TaxID=334116 RepID=A0ABM4AVG1_VANTA